jgi:hypothetical protein
MEGLSKEVSRENSILSECSGHQMGNNIMQPKQAIKSEALSNNIFSYCIYIYISIK